jgi:hypothetical protein
MCGPNYYEKKNKYAPFTLVSTNLTTNLSTYLLGTTMFSYIGTYM